MTRRASLPALLRASRKAVWILLCLWATVSACSLGGQQRKSDKARPQYQITGIAVSAKDGSAIPHCHLTASASGADGRMYGGSRVEVDADEQGRFVLDVPDDGTWAVLASAHGYRTQQLDEHDGFFTGVVLTRSVPAYDVVFRVTPDGVIRGTVSDEAGEPVRNAQVRLFAVHPEALETEQAPLQMRQATQTDDLGQYEFAELGPGGYEVEVQARPWYTNQRSSIQNGAAAAPPDPSLDVVYPITWYPGVDDDASADVLTVRGGEVLQADLRLQPVASAHILIPASTSQVAGRGSDDGSVPFQGGAQPMVSQIMPDGSSHPVFASMVTGGSSMIDVGGLAPGTYVVNQTPGRGGADAGRSSIVHVAAGGSTTEVAAEENEINVTIAVDGGTPVDPSEIRLRDTTSGRVIGEPGFGGGRGGPSMRGGAPRPSQNGGRRPQGGQEFAGRGQDQRGRGKRRGAGEVKEFTLAVPAGQYEVMVPGGTNVFLTGIAATGAQAVGRIVTIRDGAPRLTVHLASGLAKVDGTAKIGSKASVGAMVLLVPATLGDPSSLTIVRRDQSNSDGSFRLEDVIPGQYILLAIDRGWGVNWSDAATLRPYLLHGIPLEIASSAVAHPVVQATTP